jgi:hypothetical protein
VPASGDPWTRITDGKHWGDLNHWVRKLVPVPKFPIYAHLPGTDSSNWLGAASLGSFIRHEPNIDSFFLSRLKPDGQLCFLVNGSRKIPGPVAIQRDLHEDVRVCGNQ